MVHTAEQQERFDAKWMPEPMSGCWLWIGATTDNGYGKITVNMKRLYAHRVSYERSRGPIPGGMHIDHLCRTRCCVNPDHMEVVTPKENYMRGVGPAAINARKTHCIHGHEFTKENTWVTKMGRRHCLNCCARRAREHWRRTHG